MPTKTVRSTACRLDACSIRRLVATAVVAALAIAASASPLHAAGGAVAVKDIRVAGTPKLFFERPGADPGGDIAWVVLQTRSRLRVVRQVVVELRGRRGRSYTARGTNCVRSAILQGAVGLRHGATYRVRFYGRPGRFGNADTVIATRKLVARAASDRAASALGCRTAGRSCGRHCAAACSGRARRVSPPPEAGRCNR